MIPITSSSRRDPPPSNLNHPSSSRSASSVSASISSGLPLPVDVDLLSSFGDDDEEEDEGSSSAAAETSVSASSNSGESSSRGGGAQAQAPLESLKEGVAFSPHRQQPRRKSIGRLRGGRSDREEEEGFMSLVEASLEGDVTAVREALERGEKVRARDVDGRDAVLAVVLGSDKARLLTPVSSSTLPPTSDHLRILSSYLLPSPTLTLYPLNVPQPSIRSATVLGLSSYLGKSDFVKALLGEGSGWVAEEGGSRKRKRTTGRGKGWVSVDGKDGKDGTALMYAARDGHLEIAQVLLAHGARPDATESNGQSAMQYAMGRPQMVWIFEEQLRNWRAGKGKVSNSFLSSSFVARS
ncbi:hypothetical protein BDY24DRAFT_28944 [Mrakia frigida]|uniref:ankyrin repeat domain-containing protein n=1 Tax=Mrakia frigida TaxID=29902 RepID=UPI003FCC20E5